MYAIFYYSWFYNIFRNQFFFFLIGIMKIFFNYHQNINLFFFDSLCNVICYKLLSTRLDDYHYDSLDLLFKKNNQLWYNNLGQFYYFWNKFFLYSLIFIHSTLQYYYYNIELSMSVEHYLYTQYSDDVLRLSFKQRKNIHRIVTIVFEFQFPIFYFYKN